VRRAKHQKTEPLEYDVNLEAHAQEWANHLADTNQFYHEKNTGEGENLYFTTATYSSDENAIEDSAYGWYVY